MHWVSKQSPETNQLSQAFIVRNILSMEEYILPSSETPTSRPLMRRQHSVTGNKPSVCACVSEPVTFFLINNLSRWQLTHRVKLCWAVLRVSLGTSFALMTCWRKAVKKYSLQPESLRKLPHMGHPPLMMCADGSLHCGPGINERQRKFGGAAALYLARFMTKAVITLGMWHACKNTCLMVDKQGGASPFCTVY